MSSPPSERTPLLAQRHPNQSSPTAKLSWTRVLTAAITAIVVFSSLSMLLSNSSTVAVHLHPLSLRHSDDFDSAGKHHRGPPQSSLPPTPDDVLAPVLNLSWCFACENRCEFLVQSVDAHSALISSSDRALKFRELASSLPRFFRGCDHVYLQDIFMLRSDSRYFNFSTPYTRAFVQADAHLYNFGVMETSRGQISIDQNDFDQSLVGNYNVDLWRSATSLVIHMRIAGLNLQTQQRIVELFGRVYYETVLSYIGNRNELAAQLTADEQTRLLLQYGPIIDKIQVCAFHFLDFDL